MLAMQYKISFPNSYDMAAIRQRVAANGSKTDKFPGLLFKAYLIDEYTGSSDSCNEYSPLYVWEDTNGMNQFLFDGFYNNILSSFGWQKISIGIPLSYDFNWDFHTSVYAVETQQVMSPAERMNRPSFPPSSDEWTGRILIYNPDKWNYVSYHFYKNCPKLIKGQRRYQILHISR